MSPWRILVSIWQVGALAMVLIVVALVVNARRFPR